MVSGEHRDESSPGSAAPKLVLVTGAAGRIGSYFAAHGGHTYDLRLLVRGTDDPGAVDGLGELVVGELSDLDLLARACAGIDTVVHMAGQPDPNATWSSLRESNVDGVYNLFVAAKAAGVRRVVLASSFHAVSGYPPDVQVKASEPVNPGDLYGVTKCFGEALGRYMAEQEGLEVVAIRIGGFQPPDFAVSDKSLAMIDTFVSHRDLDQLLVLAVESDLPGFTLLHGLSDNRFKRLDLSETRRLTGYKPDDDFTELNASIRALHLRDRARSGSLADPEQSSGLRDELVAVDPRPETTGGDSQQ